MPTMRIKITSCHRLQHQDNTENTNKSSLAPRTQFSNHVVSREVVAVYSLLHPWSCSECSDQVKASPKGVTTTGSDNHPTKRRIRASVRLVSKKER